MTWWCSHDVSRRLTDFPELEYSLGSFDEAGRPKPIALRYAETARELRAAGTAPLTPTLAVEVAVDADDVPLSRSALAPGGVIFEEWTRLALAGPAPGTRDLGRRGGSRGACCPRDPRGDPGTAATRGGQYAAVSDG